MTFRHKHREDSPSPTAATILHGAGQAYEEIYYREIQQHAAIRLADLHTHLFN